MDDLALLDDAALLGRARDGVDGAFETLWTRYYASAFNYAKTRVGGRGFDADEVVTDAYTRIWRSLNDGRGPSTNFRAYLYAAIRTVAWDRAIRTDQSLDDAGDLAAPQLDEPSSDDDTVARCFYALNERYRTVLWLSAVEGYKPAEIGKALGIDARNASVLIMRSKESFRKMYMGETSNLGDDVSEDDAQARPPSGVPQTASKPKATSALGRHLLGGVAGLTVAQAAVAGANWASAAVIVNPPSMPASIMLAAGAAAAGGAAAASGSSGATAGSGSAGASSGGSSGGASGGASAGAASGGASTGTMVAVGVAVVAVIGAAALGISALVRSNGPNPAPPPVVTQTSTTAPPSTTTTPPATTPSESPTPETPSATSTTQPPRSTTTTQPPVNPPPPPPTTTQPPPTVDPTVPWITDGSQCTGSDQWYGPWPDGPFTHCPA
ncbi:MAG: sigma-70 family RNA polymerase sigma factor [Propionibacteriaceae bacterium]|nr:sigma-70 family RNA polymerase sigma factor [Propionibacteriaceae bacterium]